MTIFARFVGISSYLRVTYQLRFMLSALSVANGCILRGLKMWVIANRDSIDGLNTAVNDMWVLIAHLEKLARWNGTGTMHNDLVQLREIQERVSEALNEAILWE